MPEARFVDIHSHFVFGVDDGAPDLEASMAMLEQAASLNFTTLLGTPHATELTDDEFSRQLVENFNVVRQTAQKEKMPLELFLSAEMFYSPRLLEWLKYPWATFNQNKKYLLFELPLFDFPEGVGQFIFEARLKGLIPIMAHPERYRYLHDQLEKLLTFVRQGCLIQVNAGSIVGQFGSSVQKFSLKLIKSGVVQFIASDAHEIKNRSYLTLVHARQELAKFYNDDVLDNLFFHNPLNAIRANQVSMLDLDEESLLPSQEKWKKILINLKNRLFS
ncbi:tyrosine-protein phosphatase [Calditrichota bacterium LG25]